MNTTKRKIFEIATKLFAKKGYDATSVEEITSVVGVAKGTLYYHFNSKEELFNQLVKDGIDFLKKSIDIKTRKADTLIERLKTIIIIQIKVITKFDDFMIIIFSQLWGGSNRNEFVRENINSYINKIAQVISNDNKLLDIADAKIVANLMFGQLSSILMYELDYGKNFDVEELSNKYLNVLLKGIEKGEEKWQMK